MTNVALALTGLYATRAARRSLQSDEVCFAEDFAVDADTSHEIGMGELYQAVEQLKRTYKYLSITREEYVLLKAVVLLNSGEWTHACLPAYRV